MVHNPPARAGSTAQTLTTNPHVAWRTAHCSRSEKKEKKSLCTPPTPRGNGSRAVSAPLRQRQQQNIKNVKEKKQTPACSSENNHVKKEHTQVCDRKYLTEINNRNTRLSCVGSTRTRNAVVFSSSTVLLVLTPPPSSPASPAAKSGGCEEDSGRLHMPSEAATTKRLLVAGKNV